MVEDLVLTGELIIGSILTSHHTPAPLLLSQPADEYLPGTIRTQLHLEEACLISMYLWYGLVCNSENPRIVQQIDSEVLL